jgi:hypothetical protein
VVRMGVKLSNPRRKNNTIKALLTCITDVSVPCQCRVSAVLGVSDTETSSYVF